MLECRLSQAEGIGASMELSVIILNWNAANDTMRCVRQIMAWQRLQPLVWVVDNASTDADAGLISVQYPAVHLIKNRTNLGFAGGTNQGVLKSLAVGNQPILLLNNDALIAEDDVLRLLKTLQQNEKIGFVGPLLYEAEHRDRLISAGGKNPVLHHQTRVRRLDPTRSVQQVECISGTAILVQAAVFGTIGLLDENYFFSTELADLCTRAKSRGYISVIDSRARAYHALHRSSQFRDTLYPYYIIRNRFLYIRKFYRHLMKGLLYCFWGGYGLALIIRLYMSGQQATAKAVFLGLLDGLKGRFGGQNERVLSACTGNSLPVNEVSRFRQLP
jgi:GT2 family glycosyltransferase